jgi:hypothetical protein
MRWNELIMSNSAHGTRARYQAGCVCDLCKDAEAEYRRDRRRLKREAVGEFAAPQVTGLSLVTGDGPGTLASPDVVAGPVETAIRAEIDALGSERGGLKATAVALARILDNPKAVSTQPAAAGKLADLLETLRKNSDGKKSKLASVRSMTKPQVKTG